MPIGAMPAIKHLIKYVCQHLLSLAVHFNTFPYPFLDESVCEDGGRPGDSFIGVHQKVHGLRRVLGLESSQNACS